MNDNRRPKTSVMNENSLATRKKLNIKNFALLYVLYTSRVF